MTTMKKILTALSFLVLMTLNASAQNGIVVFQTDFGSKDGAVEGTDVGLGVGFNSGVGGSTFVGVSLVENVSIILGIALALSDG